jgi:hypothetical protein
MPRKESCILCGAETTRHARIDSRGVPGESETYKPVCDDHSELHDAHQVLVPIRDVALLHREVKSKAVNSLLARDCE